ncbi:Hpt domain-containing protein [Thalassolituus sp. LLYu03]|uniref:Hpt domain-containing protein n=1 Tax=Thalassolituus sp. LLYu03 TaxID=3421656 RepID=UPI003D2A3A29
MSELNSALPVWNKADALTRLMNNETLLLRVVGMFRSTAQEQLDELKAHISNERMKDATRMAHTLKGASGNIGAEQLMDVCARLERAAEQGDSATINALMPALDQAFAAALAELPA